MLNIKFSRLSNLVTSAKFSLFYFIIFATQQSLNWPLLRYWGVRGPIKFWDTNSVLINSDCYSKVGLSVYEISTGQSCTGYMYGRNLLLNLSLLNIGAKNTTFVGWLFLVALSIIFGFLTYQIRLFDVANGRLIVLIFISPPVFLLIERGNFDSLIFLIYLISVLLYSFGRSFLSFILIILLASWKFYTFPLAAIMILKLKNYFLKLIGMIVLGYLFLQILHDLQIIPNISIPGSRGAFGSEIWGRYLVKLGMPVGGLYLQVIGLLLFLLNVVIVIIIGKKIDSNFFDYKLSRLRDKFGISLFQSSYIIIISCYTVGMNYDYRLVFLSTTSVGFLLLTNAFKISATTQKSIWLLTIFSLWFSYNTTYLQPLGDLAISFILSIFSVFFWKITFLDIFNLKFVKLQQSHTILGKS